MVEDLPEVATIGHPGYSPDGEQLAIASSYTYERGDVEHASDAIFVRNVSRADVMPKARP